MAAGFIVSGVQAGDADARFDQGLAVAFNALLQRDLGASGQSQFRQHGEHVVEARRLQVFDVERAHHEDDARLLRQPDLLDTQRAQPFGARRAP